jgi:hypothetical protein
MDKVPARKFRTTHVEAVTENEEEISTTETKVGPVV